MPSCSSATLELVEHARVLGGRGFAVLGPRAELLNARGVDPERVVVARAHVELGGPAAELRRCSRAASASAFEVMAARRHRSCVPRPATAVCAWLSCSSSDLCAVVVRFDLRLEPLGLRVLAGEIACWRLSRSPATRRPANPMAMPKVRARARCRSPEARHARRVGDAPPRHGGHTSNRSLPQLSHRARLPWSAWNISDKSGGSVPQLAIGQPGVGAGSPRPDTIGDVQCSCSRDLVGDALPFGRAPTLRGRHERRVLTEMHERGQPFETETLDERAVGVAPDEPLVDDRRRGCAWRSRASLGTQTIVRTSLSPKVAKMRSITGTNPDALGPVGQHDDREVEHGRPVVERPGHPCVARDRQQRVGVLRHGPRTLARARASS